MTDALPEQPTNAHRRLPPTGSPQETRLHLTILDLRARGHDVAHTRNALGLSNALLAHAKRNLLQAYDAATLDHAMVIAAHDDALPAARDNPPHPHPPCLPSLPRALLTGWANGHRTQQIRREHGLTQRAYTEARTELLTFLDATHRTQALVHALRWNLLGNALRTGITMNIVTHTVPAPNELRLTVVEEHKNGKSPGREWGTFRATSSDTETAAVVVGDPERVAGTAGTLAEAAVYGGALHEHLRGLQVQDPKVDAVLLRLTTLQEIDLAVVGAGAAYVLHTDGTITCHSRPTDGTITVPAIRRIVIGAPSLTRSEHVLATAILTTDDPEQVLRKMFRATEHSRRPGTHLLLELPTI